MSRRRNQAEISPSEPEDVELRVRVGRAQLAAVLMSGVGRPTTVDQRTCQQVIGIPRPDYLRACRTGAFPCRAEGKRRVALTGDVERFWTRGLATPVVAPSGVGRANAGPEASGPVQELPDNLPDTDPRPERPLTAESLRAKYRLIRTG